MWKWMGRSLGRKLSLIMLITTLIPLVFLGGFAFKISSRITEEKTEQSGMDTLRQMDANLRFMLQDVENLSITLIGQSDIQQYVKYPDQDVAAQTRILALVANLASSKEYISNVTIYPINSNPVLSLATTINNTNSVEPVRIQDVTSKMWTEVYTVETFSGKKNVISFIRPLRSVNNYQTLGWLSISLDERAISRYWSQPKLGEEQGDVVLVNEKGNVLSATNTQWLSEPLESLYPGISQEIKPAVNGTLTYGEKHEKKSMLYFSEPSVKWTLIGIIPFDLYSAQNRYILQLTAIALLISVLATVGIVFFVVYRVTNPLRTLTRLLSKVNPEEPLPFYTTGTSDELGKLADSYNMLGSHIEKLKKQVIRNEARKKEADMRALQAQINPHFLYNTLSSIHWIALMTEERRIADMVGALSDFLRFSLNKGKEFCPVHQELAHIRNYAQVQSIRFPDKFEVDFVVDPEVQDMYMLKLLLQPLVENAMIHGVQKKEGKGMITVYVEAKGGQMSFLVLDDGVGMTEEQLETIRGSLRMGADEQSFAEEASYGLRNVNDRLKLHYGMDNGLFIESKLHAGTRVSFTIPMLEGGGSHESNDRR